MDTHWKENQLLFSIFGDVKAFISAGFLSVRQADRATSTILSVAVCEPCREDSGGGCGFFRNE